jgi:hypothetical protein
MQSVNVPPLSTWTVILASLSRIIVANCRLYRSYEVFVKSVRFSIRSAIESRFESRSCLEVTNFINRRHSICFFDSIVGEFLSTMWRPPVFKPSDLTRYATFHPYRARLFTNTGFSSGILYFSIVSQGFFWVLSADLSFRFLKEKDESPAPLWKRSLYSIFSLSVGTVFGVAVHRYCKRRISSLTLVGSNQVLMRSSNVIFKVCS